MMQDYLKIALGNLVNRRLRSYLTLVGIFIGIMAVVALISLGQGLQAALTSEFLALGADKLQVAPDNNGFLSDAENSIDLRERDLRAIEGANGVLYAVGANLQTSRVTWSDVTEFYSIIGTSEDPLERKVLVDFFTLKIGEGRELAQGDENKAVVGYELTNPDKVSEPVKLGDKIFVNGTRFEVVGLYKKMGDPVADNAVYLTDQGYTNVYGTKNKYTMIVVQAQLGEDINVVAENVRQELRRERDLKEGDENFDVQTPKDLVDSFQEIFNIVQFVIIGIAAISLVVGGVGIMNTMYTAVLERTKEIGIMKAIGATNKTVLLIFLFESGMLGLVGGLLGVLTGLGLAKITEYIGNAVLNTTLLQAWWSWWLVVGSLLFAFLIGITSGVLPARHASRQKPVDSLRYE